jgi:hypothetical protein
MYFIIYTYICFRLKCKFFFLNSSFLLHVSAVPGHPQANVYLDKTISVYIPLYKESVPR